MTEHSNRRPDEEGIKTVSATEFSKLVNSNRRPDEEGIKTYYDFHFNLLIYSNRRPDEEGIKTSPCRAPSSRAPIPTADLMKKGLRREEVINGGAILIPTADLMKKGLRRFSDNVYSS